MPLAGWYAAGEYLPIEAPTIPEMIVSHGLLNAVGFALCGLIGYTKK